MHEVFMHCVGLAVLEDCMELMLRCVAEDKVMLYALQVVAKIAKKGNEHAVEIVATRPKDSSEEIALLPCRPSWL